MPAWVCRASTVSTLPCQRKGAQQGVDHRGLIGLGRYRDLAQRQAQVMGDGTQEVGQGGTLGTTATQGLAVDGNAHRQTAVLSQHSQDPLAQGVLQRGAV